MWILFNTDQSQGVRSFLIIPPDTDLNVNVTAAHQSQVSPPGLNYEAPNATRVQICISQVLADQSQDRASTSMQETTSQALITYIYTLY